MALETGSQPKDLNPNWPLGTDPALLGAAHLRLLKAAVKAYLIGTFATREAFKTWYLTGTNSSSFLSDAIAVIDGRLWVIDKTAPAGNNTDGRDFFVVNSGVQARAINDRSQLGRKNSSGELGLANINSSQRRRPLVRFVNILSGSFFDVAKANSAFPNGVAVANDICIQLVPGTPSYSFIRMYTGSSWIELDIELFTRGAAYASFSAQMLSAVSVDTDRVRTARQEVFGQNNMWVIDPDGFGPDELVQWYGPKTGLVSFSGEIAYGSLTIANALTYTRKTGISGGGGEEPVPDPTPTDATVLTSLGTLAAAYSSESDIYNSAPATSSTTVSMLRNGKFSVSGVQSVTGTPQSGSYLSATAADIGDQFEVKFDASNGSSVSGSSLGVWLALSSNRSISVTAYAAPEATEVVTRQITVSVRKITTPGVVESKVVTLTADAQSRAGDIP